MNPNDPAMKNDGRNVALKLNFSLSWCSSIGAILLLSAISLHWHRQPPTTALVETPGYSYALSPPLSGWRDQRLQRAKGESDWSFVTRVNQQVFKSFYHCQYNETSRLIDKLVGITLRDTFDQVGFLTPDYLTCTLCHQSAYILARALAGGGVKAEPLGINGHVVTLVHLGNEAWIVDPDFGVGPFRYKDAMWNDVAEYYEPKIKGNAIYAEALKKAYATTADDYPFYSMKWLNAVETQQRIYLRRFELISDGIGLVGVALLFLGFFRRKPQRGSC